MKNTMKSVLVTLCLASPWAANAAISTEFDAISDSTKLHSATQGSSNIAQGLALQPHTIADAALTLGHNMDADEIAYIRLSLRHKDNSISTAEPRSAAPDSTTAPKPLAGLLLAFGLSSLGLVKRK